ncbi:hypothetical protein ACS0TY_027593 [Phlomoides rotata]
MSGSAQNTQSWPPTCWCGAGPMKTFQASPSRRNAGRCTTSISWTAGEPLYTHLKELFAPDNDPGDDELIIIVDSEDDDIPLVPQNVVHALPTHNEQPLLNDEILVISSDEDEDFLDGVFDSDVDLDYDDVENHDPQLSIDDVVSSISHDSLTDNSHKSDEEVESPFDDIPIPTESLFAIHDSLRSIPRFVL